MAIRRKRPLRPQVGQTMISLGSPEERGLGSPEERQGLGSLEEFRTTYSYPPVLMRGSTGRWVFYVQQRLAVPQTGVFDVRTEAAVRSLQASRGLAPTGIVDLATWQLIATLPTGYGFGQIANPYGSYDPYQGGYGGYPQWFWLNTFSNPSRGGGSGGGGGR